jgi:O-antigen/teichoic acid export membrane protein
VAPLSTSIRHSTLKRNVVLNLLVEVVPALAALVAIPILLRQIGTARFGVLSLAWAIIGYFSLFDLGVGRAVIKYVSSYLAEGNEDAVAAVIRTGSRLLMALGILGGLVLAALAPWLVSRVFTIPSGLRGETVGAFLLLAAAIPAVVLSAAFRGALEARQRFDLTAAVRVPMAVSAFLAPLLVVVVSPSLVAVVGALVLVRLAACAAYFRFVLSTNPGLTRPRVQSPGLHHLLLTFGGWTTVSNVVSPLMAVADRFVIGAVISAEAVAFYAAPYEIATKLLVVPNAIMGVMFPALAAAHSGQRRQARRLFRNSLFSIAGVLFPVAATLVALGGPGLRLWLGSSFSEHSGHTLSWLVVGAFLTSLGFVPFGFIQAAGRPDLTAALHLVELPVYLMAVLAAANANGVEGVGAVFAARAAVDATALFGVALWLEHAQGLVQCGRIDEEPGVGA